jgi:hypothetical protein
MSLSEKVKRNMIIFARDKPSIRAGFLRATREAETARRMSGGRGIPINKRMRRLLNAASDGTPFYYIQYSGNAALSPEHAPNFQKPHKYALF